jgi:hypothetical protein
MSKLISGEFDYDYKSSRRRCKSSAVAKGIAGSMEKAKAHKELQAKTGVKINESHTHQAEAGPEKAEWSVDEEPAYQDVSVKVTNSTKKAAKPLGGSFLLYEFENLNKYKQWGVKF